MTSLHMGSANYYDNIYYMGSPSLDCQNHGPRLVPPTLSRISEYDTSDSRKTPTPRLGYRVLFFRLDSEIMGHLGVRC